MSTHTVVDKTSTRIQSTVSCTSTAVAVMSLNCEVTVQLSTKRLLSSRLKAGLTSTHEPCSSSWPSTTRMYVSHYGSSSTNRPTSCRILQVSYLLLLPILVGFLLNIPELVNPPAIHPRPTHELVCSLMFLHILHSTVTLLQLLVQSALSSKIPPDGFSVNSAVCACDDYI